jgi:hypothetical protein
MMQAQARASHYSAQIHSLHITTHYPSLLKALLSLGVGATNLFPFFLFTSLLIYKKYGHHNGVAISSSLCIILICLIIK